jgi:predicted nucleic acid-binding Zn ribbon protein
MKILIKNRTLGEAHCPICTHTVPADIDLKGRVARVAPGQKCPRCASSLDVAIVIQIPEAA